MRMHYSIFADNDWDEDTRPAECGLQYPVDKVTKEISLVECKTCLNVLINDHTKLITSLKEILAEQEDELVKATLRRYELDNGRKVSR